MSEKLQEVYRQGELRAGVPVVGWGEAGGTGQPLLLWALPLGPQRDGHDWLCPHPRARVCQLG